MAYNDLITIESTTQARDTAGAVTDTWSTFVQVWADVETLSGSEGFNSDMVIYNDTKRFTIRYQSDKTITTKMRISYDSDYYYITSIAHRDRLRTELIAVAKDDD